MCCSPEVACSSAAGPGPQPVGAPCGGSGLRGWAEVALGKRGTAPNGNRLLEPAALRAVNLARQISRGLPIQRVSTRRPSEAREHTAMFRDTLIGTSTLVPSMVRSARQRHSGARTNVEPRFGPRPTAHRPLTAGVSQGGQRECVQSLFVPHRHAVC